MGLAILLVGFLATGSLAWTCWRIDHANERRLLQVQSRQVTDVLASTVLTIVNPLQSALAVAASTNGSPAEFDHFMVDKVGPSGVFVSASLWRIEGGALTEVASVGDAPLLPAGSASTVAYVKRALGEHPYVITSLFTAGVRRVGYAVGRKDAKSLDQGFVVYGERAIPANRRAPIDNNSAFAELNYGIYLGPSPTAAALLTTDVALSALPLKGITATDSIPFGDTTITLRTSPRRHLGGTLGAQLGWVVLAGGIVLTLGAACIASWLVRRRAQAEQDSQTISDLYLQLDTAYGEQRDIALTLQHALLPHTNPAIPNLDIASRYVAGGEGVDIGGDWYSIMLIDEGHYAFVVGDVSGRGVNAAAIMARIRFTLRAYLFEQHPPHIALEMCAGQLDVIRDGHIATVLVGVGDLNTGQVVLANAGHPAPLLISGTQADFIDTWVGPPLGVGASSYRPSTFSMPGGSTLLAYTDGLVERRDEDIDDGMRRLAKAAVAAKVAPIDSVLTSLLDSLTPQGADDDTAMLAFTWTEPKVRSPLHPQPIG